MPRGERALDAGDTPVLRFASDLRELRKQAGNPVYRELARRTHFSVAALSSAASGRKLPSLEVTLAYVAGCGGDTAWWEQRWHHVAAELAADTPDTADETCPYLGLAAFQIDDADRFFGRDQLVDELVEQVQARRFTAVFGGSGSGKSSLLRAGLAARAVRSGLGEHGPEPVVVLTPGTHPVQECAVALSGLTGASAVELTAELGADPRNLHLRIRQALARHAEGTELLLVVDQFEEVFTLCTDPLEREAFLTALLHAAGAEHSRTRVVLGVRADFYGHCGHHPGLRAALRDGQVLVGAMSVDELRETITRPAVLAGCKVETALVARVVGEAVDQPGILPLLSHALRETWHRRQGVALTTAAYESAGGIRHALAATAESVYRDLTPQQQRLTRLVLLRLTALGEGTDDTRRRLPLAELDLGTPEVGTILDRLTQARLVTVDRDSVQISHEALIGHWPRLREWLDADREGLLIHRRLTEATGAWREHQHDPGALYRGHRLSRAQDWAERNVSALTPAEQEFLTASLAAHEGEQAEARRRTRALQRLVALLVVLLLVAVAAFGYAAYAHRNASRQLAAALAEKALAEAAVLHTVQPDLAAQLRLAAYRITGSTQARNAVLSTLSAPPVTSLTGHTKATTSLAYHPKGTVLATAGADNTIRLWRLDRTPPAELAVLTGHTGYPHQIAFSPDGRLLATASWDRTARLWDLSDPAHPAGLATLTGHTDQVEAVAFLPGTPYLATGGTDQTLRLWDLTTPDAPRETSRFDGQVGRIHSLAVPPDGGPLVSIGEDGFARVWDTPDGQLRQRAAFRADSSLTATAFTPDGRVLATGGADNHLHLWSLADPGNPRELSSVAAHAEPLHHLTAGPDGRTLASTGADNTTRLWDITDPGAPHAMAVIPAATNVAAATFSPDGRTLAVTSEDHTVRLHDLGYYALGRHREQISGTSFRPGDSLLLTTGFDGRTRLWDNTGRELSTVDAPANRLTSAALHPTRPLLATSSELGTKLWDITAPRAPAELVRLPGAERDIDAVAFSPDGDTLVSANGGTIQLWRLADPRQPELVTTFTSTRTTLLSAAFTRNGLTLVTGDSAGTVKLWHLADPKNPATISDPAGPHYATAFHPGREILVTTSTDGTARLWDVSNPRAPRPGAVLRGHRVPITALAFSADGQTLATAAPDDTVRLWRVGSAAVAEESAVLTDHNHTYNASALTFTADGRLAITADRTFRRQPVTLEAAVEQICRRSPVLSPADWDRYFPDLPYDKPCA
ncbi:WD40 repeat domain-containing protein [Crossiella sp. CA-258035]|uniref:WD40 repeat domain-containing protein n=1 Tax=Crossiella sp. CA-258035 TaxID=2981138 RepID=UPI0024BC06F6|nr:WD40 repeat domain-containing protein [Crossiella sp. CA-258035]WHT22584.1 WD40 repeat domain-containing protein [Crossiella sp. CA-258035]